MGLLRVTNGVTKTHGLGQPPASRHYPHWRAGPRRRGVRPAALTKGITNLQPWPAPRLPPLSLLCCAGARRRGVRRGRRQRRSRRGSRSRRSGSAGRQRPEPQGGVVSARPAGICRGPASDGAALLGGRHLGQAARGGRGAQAASNIFWFFGGGGARPAWGKQHSTGWAWSARSGRVVPGCGNG